MMSIKPHKGYGKLVHIKIHAKCKEVNLWSNYMKR